MLHAVPRAMAMIVIPSRCSFVYFNSIHHVPATPCIRHLRRTTKQYRITVTHSMPILSLLCLKILPSALCCFLVQRSTISSTKPMLIVQVVHSSLPFTMKYDSFKLITYKILVDPDSYDILVSIVKRIYPHE